MKCPQIAIALSFVLASALANAQNNAQPNAQTKPALKVGLMLPASGTFASLGTVIENGFRLLVNEQGGKLSGREIEFVKVDDESDPSKATLNKSPTARASPLRAVCGVENPRHSPGYDCGFRLAAHPEPGRAYSRGLIQRRLRVHKFLSVVKLGAKKYSPPRMVTKPRKSRPCAGLVASSQPSCHW